LYSLLRKGELIVANLRGLVSGTCSFCGENKYKARLLGSSRIGACICKNCIKLSSNIIEAAFMREHGMRMVDIPRPTQLSALLDQYVIGQEHAKRVLAVAVYNHHKRIFFAERNKRQRPSEGDVELDKSNVLFIGSTGSGKTFLAQTLSHCLDLPFVITDATSLTEAGYVGEDVENILTKLLRVAKFEVSKAEKGIVYIDEIDKLARKGSGTREVGGEAVQQALLKLIEGTIVSVPTQGARNSSTAKDFVGLDTKNILFICGGAFEGLDKIVRSRTTESGIGFCQDVQSSEIKTEGLLALALPEDLMRYGMIPELVGRLPVVAHFEEASVDILMNILTKPRNALLRQYEALFRMDGAELQVTEGAVRAIAEKAVVRKTGARGLRAVWEKLFLDAQFRVPSLSKQRAYKIVLTEEMVRMGKSATIEGLIPQLKSVALAR
jgi:ATP-dependent Clp protease ATP-binding subunit ClpX